MTSAQRASTGPRASLPARHQGLKIFRVRGGWTVTAGNAAPWAGELAVFCRPVVTAPAVVLRDGRILADAWLPDLVRLGELERHLGDGVIEVIAEAALEKGRLRRRERRWITRVHPQWAAAWAAASVTGTDGA